MVEKTDALDDPAPLSVSTAAMDDEQYDDEDVRILYSIDNPIGTKSKSIPALQLAFQGLDIWM